MLRNSRRHQPTSRGFWPIPRGWLGGGSARGLSLPLAYGAECANGPCSVNISSYVELYYNYNPLQLQLQQDNHNYNETITTEPPVYQSSQPQACPHVRRVTQSSSPQSSSPQSSSPQSAEFKPAEFKPAELTLLNNT